MKRIIVVAMTVATAGSFANAFNLDSVSQRDVAAMETTVPVAGAVTDNYLQAMKGGSVCAPTLVLPDAEDTAWTSVETGKKFLYAVGNVDEWVAALKKAGITVINAQAWSGIPAPYGGLAPVVKIEYQADGQLAFMRILLNAWETKRLDEFADTFTGGKIVAKVWQPYETSESKAVAGVIYLAK